MGRTKIYANAAERQKAYRYRIKPPSPAPAPSKRSRPLSRPARLSKIEADLRGLLAEYEVWMDNLPESLCDSGLASILSESIANLAEAADILSETQLPKGFGRD